jgi:methyltransferase (TIGR00027 family)
LLLFGQSRPRFAGPLVRDNEAMSQTSGEINHVSDTALMVAACRAIETKREDGFIRDPFAARLAGKRGMAILDALPNTAIMRFGLGVRTKFLDELLMEALGSERIATVLSVGCGLDTRPWRLELPPGLRWIEIDFADLLDYKDGLMAGEAPRCRRERLSADLNDREQRAAMYRAAGTAPALMITEGLLMYLEAATVEALAAESSNESGIAHWISDITTTAFRNALGNAGTLQSFQSVQAPDALRGEQILEVVGRNGWTTAARRSYITDMAFAAARIEQMRAGRPRPERPPAAPDDPTGVHRFSRR